MADFLRRTSLGIELQKVEGVVLNRVGEGVTRRILVLSINREPSNPVNFYKETVNIIGRGYSASDGTFSIGVRPVRKENDSSAVHDDFNNVVVISLADEASEEQSVIYDQIIPVSA